MKFDSSQIAVSVLPFGRGCLVGRMGLANRGCIVLGWLLVVSVLHNPAAAQPSKPPFEMMRKIGERCPEHEIQNLLRYPRVCEELGLSEELVKEIQDRNRELNRKVFGQLVQLRGLDEKDSQESQTEKIVAIIEQSCEKTQKSLTEEQLKRLTQLFVQSRNLIAAANGQIAEEIGLKGEKLEALRDELEDAMIDGMKTISEKAQKIYRNPAIPSKDKRNEVEKLKDQHFADINERIKDFFTPSQLEQLSEMEGIEFEDVPKMFGGRGRRGGRGGPSNRGQKQDHDRGDRERGDGERSEGKKQERPNDCHCCRPCSRDSLCLPASM